MPRFVTYTKIYDKLKAIYTADMPEYYKNFCCYNGSYFHNKFPPPSKKEKSF